ncbi:Succinate-hydroxymethylglutarate CoA-transferase [Exophiala dermatitidis]|uniref:Formyl-CoA transferase n=1 Tax=Exophiala dermatitidis (strain ATCC 34100 / CBS 525.76 / NIH/UT8656) TaxID=858893 RepID=H6BTB3_EXODN|nr:formyl-CoA transferase [Exophiala dermatitidis NIH/UT8656]EHY53509.1 formyl-CoA transferase [Exophiala dermatitidis NIH/UT8656]
MAPNKAAQAITMATRTTRGPSSLLSSVPRRSLARRAPVSFLNGRERRSMASVSDSQGNGKKVAPLEGIRVLDMTRVLAGILGDLGAEVIKIEHPTRGDDTRAWGPPFAKYKDGAVVKGGRAGESAYFVGVNRNKKSVGLSFQHPEGIKILHELAKTSDVLVENYIPGALKKYQLDYESLRKINPRLIYASITGYGQTGPYSKRAGYDVMVEAEFGLMHITGERNGSPVKVGVAVTDLTTGLYTVNAIMASLLARQRTNQGQHLDVALSDCQTATLANIASSVLISGERDQGRWGTAHPSIVPYKGFQTADGDIMIGGGNDRLFGILCDKLGRPEWKTDPRFVTNDVRVENRDVLEPLIEEMTRTKTTQQWLDVFEGSGMPYAAINDVKDTLDHDHTKARGMVTEIQHPACGDIKLVSHPVKYSGSVTGVRSPPPTLGEHTDQVLTEVLGLDGKEVEELKGKGVVA